MDEFRERTLGQTGLRVGRLGVAASYGAPVQAFEKAFEKGCNYFYLGSGRKRAGMKQAIRNLCSKGLRDKLVVSLQTYGRFGFLLESNFKRSLKSMNLDHADILILGWHNRQPSQKLMDAALKLKEKGLIRFLGMSGHERTVFPEMSKTGFLDVFHIRYNAAHRGAETECFPQMTGDNRPGIVTYTATRWGHLLNEKKIPPEEPAPKASDCYRFVMSNPNVDTCLCGPRDMDQMDEALTSLDQGPMESQEMNRMIRIGDHIHKTSKSLF